MGVGGFTCCGFPRYSLMTRIARHAKPHCAQLHSRALPLRDGEISPYLAPRFWCQVIREVIGVVVFF